MRNTPDQTDLYRRMNMFLDNELSMEDERKLLEEIQSNPAFYELLNQERSFREFIKSRIQRRKVSPNLIESIKEKIRIHPV